MTTKIKIRKQRVLSAIKVLALGMIKSGANDLETAKAVGVSYQSIANWRKLVGLENNKRVHINEMLATMATGQYCCTEIAKVFNTDMSNVSQIAQRHNIKLPPKSKTQAVVKIKQDAIKSVQEGNLCDDVAQSIGVDAWTLSRWIKDAGLPTPGEVRHAKMEKVLSVIRSGGESLSDIAVICECSPTWVHTLKKRVGVVLPRKTRKKRVNA